MTLLDMVEQSPFKKNWLSRACRISSPSRFSRLIHGSALPDRYERQMLAMAFTKLGIASQAELLAAVEHNAQRLNKEINLDDFTVGDSDSGKKKQKT